MTDRGLPIVDGAPACPFVAFEDDRDERAPSADHRHRCYAEVRPAPRALAHQEAYCLSSAFAVCPTFQDWARREAARATAEHESRRPDAATRADNDADGADDADRNEAFPGRNPPRDWAAPPPWLGAAHAPNEEEDEEVPALPRVRGGGLAGSFADRLAGGPRPAADADAEALESPAAPVPPPPSRPARVSGGEGTAASPEWVAPDEASMEEVFSEPAASRAAPRPRTRPPVSPGVGPAWERPPRREAYPTIKTRIGLQGVTLPPILLAVVAVVLAAVALFYLPALLGVGSPPAATGSPAPSPGSSEIAATATPGEPTAIPEPTPQTYVVKPGDTMSRIARAFGVPLQALIDANKATVPNPDRVVVGQELIIPIVAPTTLPDAGSSTAP